MKIFRTFEIPTNNTLSRVGIIPYCTIKEENYYFFSIDRKYGSIIDPGGHIEESENFITGAIRELAEETFFIFDYKNCEEFISKNSLTVRNTNTACILQHFELTECEGPFDQMTELCKIFREKYEKYSTIQETPKFLLENSYLIWISETDLKQIVSLENSSKRIPLPTSLRLIFKSTSIPPNANLNLQNDFSNGLTYYPYMYAKTQKLLNYYFNELSTHR